MVAGGPPFARGARLSRLNYKLVLVGSLEEVGAPRLAVFETWDNGTSARLFSCPSVIASTVRTRSEITKAHWNRGGASQVSKTARAGAPTTCQGLPELQEQS